MISSRSAPGRLEGDEPNTNTLNATNACGELSFSALMCVQIWLSFCFWGFFFVFVFFLCISGQRLHSSAAQTSEDKNPADQKLLELRQRGGVVCLIILKGRLIESSLFLVPLMEAELQTPLSSLNKGGQISFNQRFQQMVETQLHKLMLTVLLLAPVIPLSCDERPAKMIENAAVSVKLLA